MAAFRPLVIDQGMVRQSTDGDTLLVGSGHRVMLTIMEDTSFYVATTGSDTTGDGSSGNPWATIQRALNFLADYWIVDTATVTIWVNNGTYTISSQIDLKHVRGDRIIIKGVNCLTVAVNSIQSTSGSPGNWSYVLNVASVVGLTTDDYVQIIDAAGTGTNPYYLLGCHKITNVDSGNSRITISVKQKSATVPAGSVTATARVAKAIFSCGTNNCFVLTNGRAIQLLSQLTIVGSGSGNGNAVYATLLSSATCSYIGVSGTAYGFQASKNSNITANHCAASAVIYYGFSANEQSFMDYSNTAASGCGYTGYQVIENSEMYGYPARSVGNNVHGFEASGSAHIRATGTSPTNNNIAMGNVQCGFSITAQSYCLTNYANSSGNTTYGFYADLMSTITVPNRTVGSNGSGDYRPTPLDTAPGSVGRYSFISSSG